MKRHREQVVAAAKKFTHSQLLDTKLKPGDPYFEIAELREPSKRAAVPREDGRPRVEGEKFDQFDKPWMDEHEKRKLAMQRNPHYKFLLSLSGALANSDITRLYNAESIESRVRRESLEDLQRQFNEKRYDSLLSDLRARSAELRLNRSEPLRLTLEKERGKRKRLRRQLADKERELLLANSRGAALAIAKARFVEWARALLEAVPGAAGNFARAREDGAKAAEIFASHAKQEDEDYSGLATDANKSAYRKALELIFGWIAVENAHASATAHSLRVYDDGRLEELFEISDGLSNEKAERGGGAAGLQLRYAVLSDEGEDEEIELGELEEEESDEEEDDDDEKSVEERALKQPEPGDFEAEAIAKAVGRLRTKGHIVHTRMEMFRFARFCVDYAAALKNPDVKGAAEFVLYRADNYALADAELRTAPFRPVRPIDFADLVRAAGKIAPAELLAMLERRDVVVFSLAQLRTVQRALESARENAAKRMQDASVDQFYAGTARYHNLSGGLDDSMAPIGIAAELDRATRTENAVAREVGELRASAETARGEYKALEEQWERIDGERQRVESELDAIETERRSAREEIERLTKGYHNRYPWMARPENSGLVDLDEKVIFGLQRSCEKVKGIMPDADRYYTEERGDEVLLDALMTSDATKTRFAHLTAIGMLYTTTLWNKQWSDPRTLPIQAEDEAAIDAFFQRQVYWAGRTLRARPKGSRAIPPPQPRRHPIRASLPAW